MKDVGRTMTMGVTTPVTLGFGAAIKTSADFGSRYVTCRSNRSSKW
ncbi:prophage L54a, tail tape meausure protein, family [Staphylococcus gallinarum]|uniref:Prophage L54a, tail tape meausure protein, family n=1 Tax=Staphylococcus gallinarum TaxID=1293 RepID=A0A380FDA3_STAGA|nr:prophage L54a, tail tape meausure protein, family [Staphylococcus gallinarum]